MPAVKGLGPWFDANSEIHEHGPVGHSSVGQSRRMHNPPAACEWYRMKIERKCDSGCRFRRCPFVVSPSGEWRGVLA
jgi:hypothetical protein